MERIRLFKYFVVAGAAYIFPVVALAYAIDNNWSRYPWMIVIVPIVAGALAGIWANILKGKSFGIIKGMLTAFLSFITFNAVLGVYIDGFNTRAIESFLMFTFFFGAGVIYMLFWIIPIGAVAGGIYEKRADKALQPRSPQRV